jgi:hypothetical protein
VAKSRDDLRRELDELKREMARAGFGATPLVVGVRRTGENGEDRQPGVYRQRGSVVIVTGDAEWPSEHELRRIFPDGALPLLVGGEADVSAL